MLEMIKFNEHCAAWTKNMEMNEMHVNKSIEYIYDRCHAVGYIYLNEVYQTFGAAWNPKYENHCIVFTETIYGDGPRFSIQRMNESDLTICMYW